MLSTRLYHLFGSGRLVVPLLRSFHHEFTYPEPGKANDEGAQKERSDANLPKKISGAISQKYKVFRDEDSTEILDVEEERRRYLVPDQSDPQINDEYMGLNLQRGVTGVFDIEDLVDVLRKESAHDIFVCSVPKELKYVDYMVVCSGRSFRHMVALAEFVRRIYKIKRVKGDVLPKIEGEKSRDWMALDLGNIALHIFSPQVREQYDLESLWAIGAEYDKECNKEDHWSNLVEHHSSLLAEFQPKTLDNTKTETKRK